MKKVAMVLALFLIIGLGAGMDLTKTTTATGRGTVTDTITFKNGPFAAAQTWKITSDGSFSYSGDYYNGGQVRWTVIAPSDTKTLREYWEDKPAIFTSSYSRTGFPAAKPKGNEFLTKFNEVAGRNNPNFKPITLPRQFR